MPDTPFHIVILTDKLSAESIDKARQHGQVTLVRDPGEEALLQAVSKAHALVIRTNIQITEKVIQHARNLKVIGRSGVGLDNIDLEACRKNGIAVVHTPHAATEAVADLAVGMMIDLLRFTRQATHALRDNGYREARRKFVGRELHDLTLGIVGFGRIGQALASRCRLGFGMEILFCDIASTAPVLFPARQVEFDALIQGADVISLHVPLTDLTRRMINAQTLTLCRPGAILINTARGAVVDTTALVDALKTGKLAGAALDVTEPEPLPPEHALLNNPHVIVTPHIGAGTGVAQQRMSDVIDDVILVLRGQEPAHPA
ncbi:MAG: hydroxyacid dehydrogenase [Planctomycetota bacterium]|jgi:D-3-phosphoglycerate dehydrogenase